MLETAPRIPIFDSLDSSAVDVLFSRCEKRTYADNENIVSEGDAGEFMFVIIDGKAGVYKKGSTPGESAPIIVLKEGDFFGEMPLLGLKTRSATVRSVGQSRLLIIRHQLIREMKSDDLRSYSAIITNIARALARRLLKADDTIANFYSRIQQLYTR